MFRRLTLGYSHQLIQSYLYTTQPLLPKQVVNELDKYIVGQTEAKKAVAVALRNRWRRLQLDDALRKEVSPKNILMIGPTGVGKTEIARRMAQLVNAPFIKVEATKFTEVGYHGSDVDQIIKDLVTTAIADTRKKMKAEVSAQIIEVTNQKILEQILGENPTEDNKVKYTKMLNDGLLEDQLIKVDKNPENVRTLIGIKFIMVGTNANPIGVVDQKNDDENNKIIMTIKEAREHFSAELEMEMLTNETITAKAIEDVTENGIVFIDEIDKICRSKDSDKHLDASSEGVQRDLLPLIEGSIISTKHGDIDTSKILFIASGAFYSSKPSELLPELQGRLPIRVNLQGLSENDMYRILTEPKHNLVHQQIELLKQDNVNLNFTEEAIREISVMADKMNRTIENIGARRLHTIVERIVEAYSFDCEDFAGQEIVITPEHIRSAVNPMLIHHNLRKYLI